LLVFVLAVGTVAAPSTPAPIAADPATPEADRDGARGEDEAKSARGTDSTPWLRINVEGHTGTVRALTFMSDSGRLCSAGLDKAVQVWKPAASKPNAPPAFRLERAIRWQVARGLRGSIYALASSPADGLLAVGGYGASGGLGEILLVRPADGSLVSVLKHHRQTVCSLAFSADGRYLASLDTAGAAVLWKRGNEPSQWEPTSLTQPDKQTYGHRQAAEVAKQPKLRPIVIAGDRVVLPVLIEARADALPRWHLKSVRLSDQSDVRLLKAPHHGVVVALAASRDGTRLASADLGGHLYSWDLKRNAPAVRLRRGPAAISLCFQPTDANTLVTGTAIPGRTEAGQVEIWNVSTRKHTVRRKLGGYVRACTISPNGRQLAYSGGQQNEIFVEPLDGSARAVALGGVGRRVFKVAFAKQKPYRVAFGTRSGDGTVNASTAFDGSFDTQALALGASREPASKWLATEWLADYFRSSGQGDWTTKPAASRRLEVYRDGKLHGTVDLGPQLPDLEEGKLRCFCWLADEQRRPLAIVVGTDLQNSLYVCDLRKPDARGRLPILRHFRGHHDTVNSVGVSKDLRLLVSGSSDGTARIWSLAGCEQGRLPIGRWGASFKRRGDKLITGDVDPAGPLYHKGIRTGDVLSKIRWRDARTGDLAAETDATAIYRRLQTLPWGTQVTFEYARAGVDQEAFQLLPAWQPLATLFVDAGRREWAFWTPSGYYDASVNGHRLFGWQVNRGVDRLPSFYRADQFYRKLERPDVIEHLLPAGSLAEAFRLAEKRQPPPEKPHEVLPQQIAATPRVEILSPASDEVVQRASTKVRARIEMPKAGKLTEARAMANGVLATASRIVDEEETPEGKAVTYEWDVSLPSDEKSLIQVVVDTEAATKAFDDVVVSPAGPSTPKPRLFILAVGIDRYADPKIPPLTYPVTDAKAVIQAFEQRASALYEVDRPAELLTNERVTPKLWQESIGTLKGKLMEVAQPDDLLVIFLAGHGELQRSTQRYYFVGHGLQRSDFENDVFTGCISWDDFRSLAEIPCRKLALLDTGHADALRPSSSRILKAAVRELHEDVIITVTSSTGDQPVVERREWRNGAFAKCLLSALDGEADESGNRVVTLDELVAYVKTFVPQLTENAQHPTAAPDDILRFTSFPLSHVEPPQP